MSKVLVTGGAGFIGSHLANNLVNLGHNVVIVDNFSRAIAENIKKLHKEIKIYKANITDKDLIEIFKKEKPEYVSHHAAQILVQESIENPGHDAYQNILGTINVLDCAQKTKVKKIIFSSSGGALYGEARQLPTPEDYPASPQSPYGISKLSSEYYFQYYFKQYGVPYTILRYANVYGPGQRSDAEGGVIAIFIRSLLSGQKITIYGRGTQTRDFVYINDIVSINEKALFSKKNGVYNVGTGNQTSINTLLKILMRNEKKKATIIYKKERKGEVKKSALSNIKVKKDFSWNPQISLKEGLGDMYRYYKALV